MNIWPDNKWENSVFPKLHLPKIKYEVKYHHHEIKAYKNYSEILFKSLIIIMNVAVEISKLNV